MLTGGDTSLFSIRMAPFSWDAIVPGRTTVFVMEGGIRYKCVKNEDEFPYLFPINGGNSL